MRYTHTIKSVRKRKHFFKISAFLGITLFILTFILGFTAVDAHQFLLGFLQSLTRILISYVISVFLAVIIALAISFSKKVESIGVPILDALQSFPSFSIFPLLIVWLGKNSVVTIIILVIAMIWPILFTLLSAQKQLKSDLIEAAQIYGATKFKYITYVLFPLLLPSLITGSIVAWGEAWETIIAAEIIVQVPGVGTYLALAGLNNQTHVLVIGILLLLLILFVLNKYIWLSLLNASVKYQQD